MGYTTTFHGSVKIEPPLSAAQVAYINNKICGTYHDNEDFGQPEGYCQWVISADGSAIEWNGGEKFYHASAWMVWMIDTLLRPDAAINVLPADYRFDHNVPQFTGHMCNGVIKAQGEEAGDSWALTVRANLVGIFGGDPDRPAEYLNKPEPGILRDDSSPLMQFALRIGMDADVERSPYKMSAQEYFLDHMFDVVKQIGPDRASLLAVAFAREDEKMAREFANAIVPLSIISVSALPDVTKVRGTYQMRDTDKSSLVTDAVPVAHAIIKAAAILFDKIENDPLKDKRRGIDVRLKQQEQEQEEAKEPVFVQVEDKRFSPLIAVGARLGTPGSFAFDYFMEHCGQMVEEIGPRLTVKLGVCLKLVEEGHGEPGEAYKFAKELVPGIVIKERPDLVPKPGWSAASTISAGGSHDVKMSGPLPLAFLKVAINVWEDLYNT